MSTNSNDQNVVPAGKILTTSKSRTVSKFTWTFAGIGLLIGVLLMFYFNFGIHDKLIELLTPAPEAMVEVVAHNASDEEPILNSDDLKEIDLDAAQITFGQTKQYTYNGEYHEIVATNTQFLPAGVTVTYANNRHKDAGTYTAVAIFSGKGYKTKALYADWTIDKATVTGISLPDALVEYNPDVQHELSIVGELPDLDADGNPDVEVSYSLNKATDVGVYKVTAFVYGENYNHATLEATLTIVNLKDLVFFPDVDEEKGAIVFDYDRSEHIVELDTSKVLSKIVEERNLKVEYKNGANTLTNAGEYTVTAIVSADGFTTFEYPVKVIVNKGDIEKVYGLTVNSDTVEYDTTSKYVTYKFGNGEDSFITATCQYYALNSDGTLGDLLSPQDVCNPATYRVILTFEDTTGNCETKVIERDFVVAKRNISGLFSDFADFTARYEIDGETELAVVRRLTMVINTDELYDTVLAQPLVITYTYGDQVVVATYVFGENGVTLTYTVGDESFTEEHNYGYIPFEIPIDFTEVGTYVLKATVSGNDYDADANLSATCKINYANLAGVTVLSNQIAIVDGNYKMPKYTAKSGTTVEIQYNGETVEGIKYAGIYYVTMIFTNGNYQKKVENIRFFVLPNPAIALGGLAIGVLLGLLIGCICAIWWEKKEKSSHTHFRGPGAIVANARGGIICESYAKCENSGCVGRLYLSGKALEFYADDYKALKDNFLIDIDDVRNVDAIAANKIKVYVKRSGAIDAYVFTIPDGTSREWVEEIIKA